MLLSTKIPHIYYNFRVVSKTRNGVTGNGVTRNRVTGFFCFFLFVLFSFFALKRKLKVKKSHKSQYLLRRHSSPQFCGTIVRRV